MIVGARVSLMIQYGYQGTVVLIQGDIAYVDWDDPLHRANARQLADNLFLL